MLVSEGFLALYYVREVCILVSPANIRKCVFVIARCAGRVSSCGTA